MDFYTTSSVAKLFSVSDQTVKNWAREFAFYLSATAQPGDNKRRTFTTDDVEVFALVHAHGDKGLNYEDAHAALKTGQRGVIPGGASALATAAAPAALLDRMRDEMAARDQLISSLRTESDKRLGQIELLEKQLTEKEALIRNLYKDIARLEIDAE